MDSSAVHDPERTHRSPPTRSPQPSASTGVPGAVITRAKEILAALERDELARSGRPSLSETPHEPQQQLGLFHQSSVREEAIVRRLRELDPNRLTPLEALALLAELKKEADA